MSNHTLKKYDVRELADTVKTFSEGNEAAAIFLVKAQQLLLDGRPVSPEQIATSLQMSRDEVTATLRYMGAAFDEDGNLVGLGLSVVPTKHSYKINGRQLYVWCAADAITFPIFHKAAAVIESPDPISGELIRLTSSPEGASDIEPSTAVVTWMPGTESYEKIRANICNFTNFFASVKTASQYVSKHPELIIVSVDDVFQLARILREKEPFKSVIESL